MKKGLTIVVAMLTAFVAVCQKTVPPPKTIAADVSITSLTLGYTTVLKPLVKSGISQNPKNNPDSILLPIKCIVVIHNDYATAHQVSLIVNLPRNVTMDSYPAGATQSRNFPFLVVGTPEYRMEWVVPIGDMSAGQTLTEVFVFTPTVKGNKVTAAVTSNPADNDPSNNQKGTAL